MTTLFNTDISGLPQSCRPPRRQVAFLTERWTYSTALRYCIQIDLQPHQATDRRHTVTVKSDLLGERSTDDHHSRHRIRRKSEEQHGPRVLRLEPPVGPWAAVLAVFRGRQDRASAFDGQVRRAHATDYDRDALRHACRRTWPRRRGH